MHREELPYTAGQKQLRGYLCHNKDIHQKRPGIIVAHAWRGLDDFAKRKAERLAQLGYIAFAADLYGINQPVTSDEEAGKLMLPLFLDRPLLQERIKAAYQTLSKQPLVDASRIGAIGFCFGGLTVIELLRSGVGLRGAVSFHGGLANKRGDATAKTVPIASNIKGSLLILHGHDDPSVAPSDINALQTELTQAKIDWQMVIYGHTMHAFTNPNANNPSSGMLYNESADRRSWIAMRDFFDEIFKFER